MQDDNNFDFKTFAMDRESYKEFLISDDDDFELQDDEYTDEVLVFHNNNGAKQC